MTRSARWWLALAVVLAGLTALGQPARPDPDDEDSPVEDWSEDGGSNADGDLSPAPRTPPTHAANPNELTDDQAAAVGLGAMCCCGAVGVGLLVLIIWAVRRSSKGGPTVSAPAAAPGAIQLSIFALGLEPQAREVVEQQLAQLGVSPVPTTPDGRGRLVREAARALLTVQPSWRQFGYGEKPGLVDLAAAQASYLAASQDFRARATSVTPSDNGLVVVTLLVCSRRGLVGVSRLDDPQQVRALLDDRMRIGDPELLGAELLWAPLAAGGSVTEAEISLRFPEMLPLVAPTI